MGFLILDGFDGYADLTSIANRYTMGGMFAGFSTTARDLLGR